jgi:hypothetical protein
MKKISDKELLRITNYAIENFTGVTGNLNSAIGMLFLGNRVGWKPLFIMFDKKTIRKNEEILFVKFRDILPEEGDRANKSVAWETYQKVKATNFWKVVSGDIKGIKTPKLESD